MPWPLAAGKISPGPVVRELLERHGLASDGNAQFCPMMPDEVRQRLEGWTDAEDCDAIFTTGGLDWDRAMSRRR